MDKIVNIEECFGMFADTFTPKIVGELNGQLVLLVRCEGDKVPWHTHDKEDEMFYVLEGTLDIFQKDQDTTTVQAGEFFIVRKNVEHRVVPRDHVKLMLFEPQTISHTGNVKAEITLNRYDRLDP